MYDVPAVAVNPLGMDGAVEIILPLTSADNPEVPTELIAANW